VSKIAVPEGAVEISAEEFNRAQSPTAASVSNRLYGGSGAMDYRVVLGQSGGAMQAVIVNAPGGDDAAAKALAKYPGWKVVNINPASSPDGFRSTDELAAA
jgi:hypothetical protein